MISLENTARKTYNTISKPIPQRMLVKYRQWERTAREV